MNFFFFLKMLPTNYWLGNCSRYVRSPSLRYGPLYTAEPSHTSSPRTSPGGGVWVGFPLVSNGYTVQFTLSGFSFIIVTKSHFCRIQRSWNYTHSSSWLWCWSALSKLKWSDEIKNICQCNMYMQQKKKKKERNQNKQQNMNLMWQKQFVFFEDYYSALGLGEKRKKKRKTDHTQADVSWKWRQQQSLK